MEANKNSKKIVILGLILLIIAGIIVVALKGFNVSLIFGKHEVVEFSLGVNIDMEKVENIAKEIFGDKKFEVRELEVFGDSAQINIKSITDDEKTLLINKINQEFGTTKTVEDLNVYSISNKRIRDVVNIYILPIAISFVIVFIYESIRFRKIKILNQISLFIGKLVLLETVLLSIISITRIPVNNCVINILIIIAILYMFYFNYTCEKRLKSIE